MAKKLTAIAVENAQPGERRQEIPDGLLTGLYLVVQPSGAKSWAVRYRHRGKPRKLTLGPYPALELKHAREMAGVRTFQQDRKLPDRQNHVPIEPAHISARPLDVAIDELLT